MYTTVQYTAIKPIKLNGISCIFIDGSQMLDLLSFWTGGNRITGKNRKLLVKFDDGVNDLPLSETCFGAITLPAKHSDYQSFKQNMDIAIKFGS